MNSSKAFAEEASSSELASDRVPVISSLNWEGTIYPLSDNPYEPSKELTLQELLSRSNEALVISPKASAKTRKAIKRARRWPMKLRRDLAENLFIASVILVPCGIVAAWITTGSLKVGNTLGLVIWLLGLLPGLLVLTVTGSVALLNRRTRLLGKRLRKLIGKLPQSEIIVYRGKSSLVDQNNTKFYVSDTVTPEALFDALVLLEKRDEILSSLKVLRQEVVDIHYAVRTTKSDQIMKQKKLEIESKVETVAAHDKAIAELLVGHSGE